MDSRRISRPPSAVAQRDRLRKGHAADRVQSVQPDELPLTPIAPAVIVLGVFRSGTSLVSQMTHELGLDFGPMVELGRADFYNPGGYFERPDVVHINGRLLEAAGGSFAEPPDPEIIAARSTPDIWNAAHLHWIHNSAEWGLKDPRLCATLLAWIQARRIDPNRTRIILVTREAAATARSAANYPGVSDHFGAGTSIAEAVERYAELANWHSRTLGLPTLALQYEAVLSDPAHCATLLAGFLNVTDRVRIERAASLVGKRRAHVQYNADRIRRKFLRLLGLLTD